MAIMNHRIVSLALLSLVPYFSGIADGFSMERLQSCSKKCIHSIQRRQHPLRPPPPPHQKRLCDTSLFMTKNGGTDEKDLHSTKDSATERFQKDIIPDTTTTNSDNDKQQNTKDDMRSMSFQDQVDDFLDRSFFDPEEFDDSDDSLLGKFARLVKADYELAETLYVGIIFVVLIIVTQEVLRMQLYGDSYIPFVKGSATAAAGAMRGGKLF
jgi:hypothetical protein